MEWSTAQMTALDEVGKWLEDHTSSQTFSLFGWAGSGKTTLAKHFAEGVSGNVLFGAYTGKAAHVLQQKGCPGAMTLHKMMYRPRSKSEKMLRELKAEHKAELDADRKLQLKLEIDAENENLKRPSFTLRQLDSPILGAELVIVDEISTVNEEMGQDLLSFGTPVLVLGDPFQLPPIKGGGYFTNVEPDIMFTEIHRQAQGSPVIQMSMDVREGRGLKYGDYGHCRVMTTGILKISEVVEFDQILCGRNATRRQINRMVRDHLGLSVGEDAHLPKKGDKVVCLKNDHDIGILNGSIWRVHDNNVIGSERMMLTISEWDDEEGETIMVETHRAYFEETENDLPYWEINEAASFDYGYALTVHKAQGSQWQNVLLIDESRVFRASSDRWLYTGLTRAQESVTVVR